MAKKKKGEKKKISTYQSGGGIPALGDFKGLAGLDLEALKNLDLSQIGQAGFLDPLNNGKSLGVGTAANGVQAGSLSGLLGSGGSDQLGIFQNLLQELTGPKESRLNVNQLSDINRFKVKPSRGFLSFQGGGVPTKEANNAQAAQQLGQQEEVQPLSLLLSLAEGQQLLSNFGTPTVGQVKQAVDINELKKGGKVGKMQTGGLPSTNEPTPPTDDFALILEKLGEPEEKVSEMLDRISFHETGSKQRLQPTAKQLGGGPGRGLFMFEPDSLETAANRYKRFSRKNGTELPDYVKAIRAGDRDASKLSAEQQRDIFLVDQLERRGGKDIKKTLAGELPIDKFWRKNVWAGPESQESARLKSFNASQTAFDNEYTFDGGDLPEVSVTAPRSTDVNPTETTRDNTAINTFSLGDMAKQGYKDNSPFRTMSQIEIPSNNITMDGVGQDLLLIPDGDVPKIARANSGNHVFSNSTKVLEIPTAQFGGTARDQELMQYLQAMQTEGGIPQAGFGGFFKKIGKGIGKAGKAVGKAAVAVGKGFKDVGLFGLDNASNLLLGADIIKDGAYSYGISKDVSGVTGNALNKIGDVAVPLAATLVNPGLGAAIGGIRGTTNALGDGKNIKQALGAGLLGAGTSFLGAKALGSTGGLGNIGGNFMNLFKGGQGLQNGLNIGGDLLSALSGGGGATSGNSAAMAALGIGGSGLNFNLGDQAPTSNPNVLAGLFGNVGRFEEGGFVGLDLGPYIPIQTEKVGNLPEQLLHLDGAITAVQATKSHKQMKPDEVTDLVLEGTYVASAANSMKITRKSTEDIVIGVKHNPYKEDQIGKIPELWTFDSLFGKKTKMRPAELALEIKKKFPIVEKGEVRDPFTLNTNRENLINRAPWMVNLIQLNEKKRTSKSVDTFQEGGYPKQFQNGGYNFGDIIGVAGTALPLLSQLFGNNQAQQGSGVDPLARALSLGSLPLAAAGSTQNIRSRQGALDGALTNFQGLTSDLQGLNNQGTIAGIGGRLLQDTSQERLSLDTSRLQNFNTRTPRSFANALSTPGIDVNSAIGRLGSRAGSVLAGNVNSDIVRNRNQALIGQFNQDRNLDLSLAQQITGINNQEAQYNNGLANQEISNRNGILAGIAGDVQGNIQNQGNILSNAFNVGTNLQFQRAALDGQIPIALAQTLQNGAGLLQGQQSVAAQQQQTQGAGNSSFLNFLESLQIGNRTPTGTGTAIDNTISNGLPPPVTLGTNLNGSFNGGFSTPPYIPTAQDIYGG